MSVLGFQCRICVYMYIYIYFLHAVEMLKFASLLARNFYAQPKLTHNSARSISHSLPPRSLRRHFSAQILFARIRVGYRSFKSITLR